MKILIACEESQRVCAAFREEGHEAFSCDIQECSGGHSEWHIKGDATKIVDGYIFFDTMDGVQHYVDKWGLIIAHPPCTYLSNVSAPRLKSHGVFNKERYEKLLKARSFFMTFFNADCDKICIENPVPLKIANLPKYTQIIQPYYFGEAFSKKTCLWLKGLPPLIPTNIINDNIVPWVNAGGTKIKGVAHGAKERSKTFRGIAKAMAEQWGGGDK